MSELTLKQKERLAVIGREQQRTGRAAWWNSATDKSLLRRGLIERCDDTKVLGPEIKFVTHLCRLTDVARALAHREPTNG